MIRTTLPILPFLALSACGENPPCAALSGVPHEQCLAELAAAVPPTQMDAVLTAVSAISDPIVRDATVLGYVEDHGAAISRTDGLKLCQLTTGWARGQCDRKLQSPHLHRTP